MKRQSGVGRVSVPDSQSALRGGSQHTPGPWKFWDREDYNNSLITDESGAAGIARPIANIHVKVEGVQIAEMRANGRLIAAAPELLTATKRAYQAFNNILEFRIINDPDKREAVRDIVAQLARALVKAEGTTADERTSPQQPAPAPPFNAKGDSK